MTIEINKDIRKLVSIKRVDKIAPIKDADLIELVILGGWQVVVKKGSYKQGDEVLYFEIDSFLPDGIEPFQFLVDKTSKNVLSSTGEDVKGHVLKTVRLRGELSQGLVLPLSEFPNLEDLSQKSISEYFENLGVFKYEKPLPIDGKIIGHYPNHTLKTDSERVQNLSDEFLKYLKRNKKVFKATEKIDGTSTTWWKDEENVLHVASRNYELELDSDEGLKAIVEKYDLYNLLKPNEIIKAELYGEGIQSNPLKVRGKHLALFDWELDNRELPNELKDIQVKTYDFELPDTVEEVIKQVDKLKSLINPKVQAEGVVWWIYPKENYKELGYRPNFKAINNSYLIKNG